MACRDVCAPWSEDGCGVAQFSSHTVDDRLGGGWLCFRALRNVEGAAKKIAVLLGLVVIILACVAILAAFHVW
jgi:hypothetical protein